MSIRLYRSVIITLITTVSILTSSNSDAGKLLKDRDDYLMSKLTEWGSRPHDINFSQNTYVAKESNWLTEINSKGRIISLVTVGLDEADQLFNEGILETTQPGEIKEIAQYLRVKPAISEIRKRAFAIKRYAINSSLQIVAFGGSNQRTNKGDDIYRAAVLDPNDGHPIHVFGDPYNGAKGEAELIVPKDIAVDKYDNIYITDQGASQVKKYDKRGSFVKAWGKWGEGPGEFRWPTGIIVDNKKEAIYIAEHFKRSHIGGTAHYSPSSRIQKFTLDGEYIGEWGKVRKKGWTPFPSDQSYDYDVWGPEYLALDSRGHLYIYEELKRYVSKWDENGNLLLRFSVDHKNWAKTLRISPQDELWLAFPDLGYFSIYDTNGKHLRNLKLTIDPPVGYPVKEDEK